MSKKIIKIKPLEDPPIATSSDDDDGEAESSSPESDSDSGSDKEVPKSAAPVTVNNTPVKFADPVTVNNTPVKSAVSESNSDSGSESESGSDSGSDQDVPIPTPTVTVTNTPVKPGVSKSDSGSGSESESDSDFETELKPSRPVTVAAPRLLRSALKRPASESTAKKRVKTMEEEEGSDSKKILFQRVWSEEDEITLLQGMIDFNGDTGESPYENIDGFFEVVEKNFSFKPSKTQFMQKIRSLKKKYRRNKGGGFSKAHDKRSMGLGKLIWGTGGFACESSVVKCTSSNGKAKVSEKKKKKFVKPVEKDVLELHTVGLEADWFETSFVVKSIAGHGLDEDYVKRKWRSASMEDKKRLEGKYEVLRAKEVEYSRFKAEFLRKISPMIFKSS